MSRVGKRPISIPNGVEVVLEGSKLLFKGAKSQQELETFGRVNIEIKDGNIWFAKSDDTPQSRAYWGTYRALANNIVIGLSSGFTKVLEINGVGYKANVNGHKKKKLKVMQ